MSSSDSDFMATVHLVSRAQSGDQEALDQLLHRYQDRLLTRIRLLLGPKAREHAQSTDFLQEVMLEVVRGFQRFQWRDERAFLRWVTQIARNNIRDALRRRREKALESFSSTLFASLDRQASPPPEEQVETQDEIERMLEALEKLSEAHREVIELRDLEGLAYREIATRMNRSSEEAAQMLHARALTALTKFLV
jgi:RNA polymerase sigma-70 factor (ECF subfamily)